MAAIAGRLVICVALLAVALLSAACFQTANVQPNTGIQLEPMTTVPVTATDVAVAQAPESLPVITVTPAATEEDTVIANAPAAESAPAAELSAAQLEATQIVMSATSSAESSNTASEPAEAEVVDASTVSTEKEPVADDAVETAAASESLVAAEPATSCIHIIREEDTLYGLALRYSTTVSELVETNDIQNADIISLGQQIVIPTCGTASTEIVGTTEGAAALAVIAPVTHIVSEGGRSLRDCPALWRYGHGAGQRQ